MEGRKPPWAHGWGLSHCSSGEALVGFGGQPQVPVCFVRGSVSWLPVAVTLRLAGSSASSESPVSHPILL